MPLLKKQAPKDITYTNKVAALIQRRRLQVLVHSYIYYVLGKNLVSDKQWDEWAKELVELQAKNPKIAMQVMYHKELKSFDATTGFHLKYDARVKRIARRLLNYDKRREG